MAPPVTDCSSQESGSCIFSGQHGRAGTGGKGAGEPELRTRKQESWPCHWLCLALGELASQRELEAGPDGVGTDEPSD